MADHLGCEPYDPTGRGSETTRNGFAPKPVTTEIGGVELRVPRDRNGTRHFPHEQTALKVLYRVANQPRANRANPSGKTHRWKHIPERAHRPPRRPHHHQQPMSITTVYTENLANPARERGRHYSGAALGFRRGCQVTARRWRRRRHFHRGTDTASSRAGRSGRRQTPRSVILRRTTSKRYEVRAAVTSRSEFAPRSTRLSLASVGSWQAVALVTAVFLGFAVTNRPTLAVLIAAALVIFAWPHTRSAAPRTVVVLLAVAFLAGFLPGAVSLAAQLALSVIALVWGIRSSRTRPSNIPGLVLVIIAWWTLLLLHPNVPDISTGILGLRKSTFALVGLVLGWAWPHRSRSRVEYVVVFLLIISLAGSLAMHSIAPDVEAGIVRGAGEATARFAGQQRLQGLFAGPFHVALAASFLCVWGIARWSQHRAMAVVALIVGIVALNEAAVRTGYLAVLVGWLALSLAAGTTRTRVKRFSAVLMALVIGTLALSTGVIDSGASVGSLTSLPSDSRVQDRLPQMHAAIELIAKSPLIGWGPGAAGDAMGDRFSADRVHVTAHNVVLKLGVEGGLLGLLLVGALLVALWRRIEWRSSEGVGALCALSVMTAFGLSGSMIEALPVTLVLLALVGVAAK